jgi:hypothetical protein
MPLKIHSLSLCLTLSQFLDHGVGEILAVESPERAGRRGQRFQDGQEGLCHLAQCRVCVPVEEEGCLVSVQQLREAEGFPRQVQLGGRSRGLHP